MKTKELERKPLRRCEVALYLYNLCGYLQINKTNAKANCLISSKSSVRVALRNKFTIELENKKRANKCVDD